MAVRVPYQRRLNLRGKRIPQTAPAPGPMPQMPPRQPRLPFAGPTPGPQQLPLPLQSAFGGGPGVRVSGLPAPIQALMDSGLAPMPAHGPLDVVGEPMPGRMPARMGMGEVIDGEVVSPLAPSWLKRLAAIATLGAGGAAALSQLGGDAGGPPEEPMPALVPSHGPGAQPTLRGRPAPQETDRDLATVPPASPVDQGFSPDPAIFAKLFGQPPLEEQLQQTESPEQMVARLLGR